MAIWEVSEESVSALYNMSAHIQELTEKIYQETQQLKESYDENKDGLGAHSADIQALLDELESTEQAASLPAKKLVLKLTKAAVIRQKHIETQRYTQSKGKTR